MTMEEDDFERVISEVEDPSDRAQDGRKKLKPYHWRMISMCARGYTNRAIAEEFGVSEGTVSSVLRTEQAMEAFTKLASVEGCRLMTAGYSRAVDTVLEAMDPDLQDMETRLKGVDRFAKLAPQSARERQHDTESAQQVNIQDNRNILIQQVKEKAKKVEDKGSKVEEADKALYGESL